MQPESTVESLPDAPLTHDLIDDLTDSGSVKSVHPITSKRVTGTDGDERLITRQILIRLRTSGYLLVYDDERGWVVQDRATEGDVPAIPADAETVDDTDYDDELVEALMFRSQLQGLSLPDPPSTSATATDGGATDANGTALTPASNSAETDADGDPGTGTGTRGAIEAELTTDGSMASGPSLTDPTGNPELDPTAPTTDGRDLTCLVCGETVSESAVEYVERDGESRWWCPTDGCDGSGIGIDLLAV